MTRKFHTILPAFLVILGASGCASMSERDSLDLAGAGKESVQSVFYDLAEKGLDDLAHESGKLGDPLELAVNKDPFGRVQSAVLKLDVCHPLVDAAAAVYAVETGLHDSGLLFFGIDFEGALAISRMDCIRGFTINRRAVDEELVTTSTVRAMVMAVIEGNALPGVDSRSKTILLRPPEPAGVDQEFAWAILLQLGPANTMVRGLEVQTSKACILWSEVETWANTFRAKTQAGVNIRVTDPHPGRALLYEDPQRPGCVGRIRASSI